MFLYMLSLAGIFVAAFLNPTNAGLTYTALGMALGPQVYIFMRLTLRICNICCPCIEKVDSTV